MFTLRRRAARAVLLDPGDCVLLLAAHDPANPSKGSWWEIPGGGIDPGETSDEAARRELYEETGIEDVEIGPCVWIQHVQYSFAGIRFDQEELIHVARCDGGVYRPAGLESIEAAAFEGGRWFTLAELERMFGAPGGAEDRPPARLLPPWLPERLPAVLEEGFPDQPVNLGDVASPL
jgi:8-oxo-dGTP pyrophosphatase MutT (NUDIX family)